MSGMMIYYYNADDRSKDWTSGYNDRMTDEEQIDFAEGFIHFLVAERGYYQKGRTQMPGFDQWSAANDDTGELYVVEISETKPEHLTRA